MGFSGKVVLITGGGSGIGEATAATFAREGASVMIADINTDAGTRTSRRLTSDGWSVASVHVDVSTEAGATEAVQETIRLYGQVDVLINSAGIEISGRIAEFSSQDFDRLFNVNVRGVFLCSREVSRHMMERRRGVIINMASVASIRPWPLDAAYSATKAGVMSLTLAMALELAPYAIRVNAVAPGLVETPLLEKAIMQKLEAPSPEALLLAKNQRALLHPLGRLATPDDVAKAVLFLSSEDAGFITGAVLPVDGGFLAR